MFGTAAKKSAGLIDAEGQRSTTKGDIAQRRRDLAPPGIKLIVERWLPRPINMVVTEMILQVLPNRPTFAHHLDAEGLQ